MIPRFIVKGYPEKNSGYTYYKGMEDAKQAESLAEVLIEGDEMNFATVYDQVLSIIVFQVENKPK